MLEKIKNDAKKDLKDIFEIHDEIEEYNSRKILDAFIENNISENDFNSSTGYGYNDIGTLRGTYKTRQNKDNSVLIVETNHKNKAKRTKFKIDLQLINMLEK